MTFCHINYNYFVVFLREFYRFYKWPKNGVFSRFIFDDGYFIIPDFKIAKMCHIFNSGVSWYDVAVKYTGLLDIKIGCKLGLDKNRIMHIIRE